MAFPDLMSDVDRADERLALVREVALEARDLAGRGEPEISQGVLDALSRVPRHRFVPPAQRPHAYLDQPLPIGFGQTISQPYIVALMTELARVDAGSHVLEVGTGCGYQAAVLAELAGRVFSIELVDELAEEASERLARLGYGNVEVRAGDGWHGWAEHAPFDAILVTAAAPEVPPALLEQLALGGRLVVPVGEPGAFAQRLELLEKDEAGVVSRRTVAPVAFVPLRRRRSPPHDGGRRADDTP